jgi:hypothetical protein
MRALIKAPKQKNIDLPGTLIVTAGRRSDYGKFGDRSREPVIQRATFYGVRP